jgi:hypothetical protein
MYIEQGYTMWARKTLESKLFQERPDVYFKIFFYLVLRANHETNSMFQRGSNHVIYNMIIESTGATRGQVDHCFRWLKKEGMLTTKKSTRGLHFTIVNYNKYQSANNYKSDMGATSKRNGRDTINNNVKNEKNEISKKRQSYKSKMGSDTDESGRIIFIKNGKKCIKGSDGGTYEV